MLYGIKLVKGYNEIQKDNLVLEHSKLWVLGSAYSSPSQLRKIQRHKKKWDFYLHEAQTACSYTEVVYQLNEKKVAFWICDSIGNLGNFKNMPNNISVCVMVQGGTENESLVSLIWKYTEIWV